VSPSLRKKSRNMLLQARSENRCLVCINRYEYRKALRAHLLLAAARMWILKYLMRMRRVASSTNATTLTESLPSHGFRITEGNGRERRSFFIRPPNLNVNANVCSLRRRGARMFGSLGTVIGLYFEISQSNQMNGFDPPCFKMARLWVCAI